MSSRLAPRQTSRGVLFRSSAMASRIVTATNRKRGHNKLLVAEPQLRPGKRHFQEPRSRIAMKN